MNRIIPAVLSLCLLAAAAVSVMLAWVRLDAQSAPVFVLTATHGRAGALAAETKHYLQLGPSQSGTAILLAKELAREEPLSDRPFVVAAKARFAEDAGASTRRLWLVAVARWPGNLEALNWLANDAIKRGDFHGARLYLDRLALLAPASLPGYAEILVGFPPSEVEPAISEGLAKGLPLARAALGRLNAKSIDVEMLVRLNANWPEGRAQVVSRILAEEGPRPAYAAWQAFLPGIDQKELTTPFDPVFLGNPAPPPFNWRLGAGAKLIDLGGLYVSYSGGDATFAQQTLMLTPGRYVLSVDMDGDTPAHGPAFEWGVVCEQNGATLGLISANALGVTLSNLEVGFTVPVGPACISQRLSLRGLPSNVAGTARATVRKVAIEAAVSP